MMIQIRVNQIEYLQTPVRTTYIIEIVNLLHKYGTGYVNKGFSSICIF
jgi:hypothetical protein